jgi:anti-anti-sigma regulatory factor
VKHERTERIPLQVSRGSIVASIQVDLDEFVLRQFGEDLLELLHSSGLGSVIVDVSGVDIMDGEDFQALCKTLKMAELMGARCIVAGLQPGVVSSLVALDVDVAQIETVLDLDSAFDGLEENLEREDDFDTPVSRTWTDSTRSRSYIWDEDEPE